VANRSDGTLTQAGKPQKNRIEHGAWGMDYIHDYLFAIH